MSDTGKLETVKGRGGDGSVSEDTLIELKSLVEEIRTDVSHVTGRRRTNEDLRFCRWSGQSDDGRKRRAALGKEAFPFEGASDSRVRLADMVVNEGVRTVVAAATRVTPKAIGVEGTDEQAAGKMSLYLRWLIRNRWGIEYRRCVELLGQYMLGDTPAVGVAMVDWFEDAVLEYEDVRSEDVMAHVLALTTAPGEAEIADVRDLLTNTARAPELGLILRGYLGDDLTDARLERVALELVEKGVARVPVTRVKWAGPRMTALRVNEDVFYPDNTMDLQRARAVIVRQWLSKAEVMERAVVDGWSDGFVEGLLGKEEGDKGQEGKSGFDDGTQTEVSETDMGAVDPRKGLYEVLTSFRRAANADGVPGIYVEVFSYFVEVAAKERVLWPRKHGLYPFVPFSRESLTSRLNDSRGLPELLMTDQNAVKLLRDSFEDHVQVTTNPPIKRPRGRPHIAVTLAPFGQVEEDRADSVKFMERPPYPTAADKYWKELRRGVNEYLGRVDGETYNNDVGAVLAGQDLVDRFLGALSECFAMVIQLVQQYETDEGIQRVVGGAGMEVARSADEIRGRYDLQMTFDVRDLSLENVITKAKVVLENIRPLDQYGMLPYESYLRRIVAAIDPSWADEIPPMESAWARVAKDEQGVFVQMLNGVQPDMPEKIDAPKMRLEVLNGLMGPRVQNPGAFPPIAPAALALLNARQQFLAFQAKQEENALTGRMGVEQVDLSAVGADGSVAQGE